MPDFNQKPSTYSFQCVCGHPCETEQKESVCPHCNRVLQIEWSKEYVSVSAHMDRELVKQFAVETREKCLDHVMEMEL